MMAVGAFNQVHSSLKWFVANVSAITDWRATLLRVAAFRRADHRDTLHGDEQRIDFVENDSATMTFENPGGGLPLGANQAGRVSYRDRPWSTVNIIGDPRAGKDAGLSGARRALALGSGRVGMPCRRNRGLHSSRALFPRGPAARRPCLSARRQFPDKVLVTALSKVGLDHLRLRSIARPVGTRTRRRRAAPPGLRPASRAETRWVVIDEALETMDADALKRALSIFEADLRETAVIKIGRTPRNGVQFSA